MSLCYPRVRMDYYEKCFYQNIIYRYLIIYIYEYSISNTSSFEINWVFLVGGQNYPPPPYKTLGWGPVAPCVTNLFSRALQQLKSIWPGKCNPLENVFYNTMFSLKDKRHDIIFTKQISVTRISNLPSKFHVLFIF